MTLALTSASLAYRGRSAVDNVTLVIPPAAVTVVLGLNGAGKSSLLKLLAGLIAPASGGATLDGRTLASVPPRDRARRIGYLPQAGAQLWDLIARDVVMLGRLPHRGPFTAPGDADRAAVESALVSTDMLHLADRPIGAMSGGERARVLFARVLAGEPEWLLVDEPLADLDPPHQQAMLTLMRNAAAEGRGVVAVLHDLNAAAAVGDHVVLMCAGRIVESGPPSQVFTPEKLARAYGIGFDVIDLAQGTIILPSRPMPN